MLLRIDVPQAWNRTAEQALLETRKIDILQRGYGAGSTEWSFLVETEISKDKVQDILFGAGLNWARVTPQFHS